MNIKKAVVYPSLLSLVVLGAVTAADAAERIRIRAGKTSDTVVIDEASDPPMITVSADVTVRGAPGSILPLGGGQYQILAAGNATYHVKTRGASDSVTVIDGPGSSSYWLGVGADTDSVVVQDGPGDDSYTIEGKRGDDTYDILDDAGDGNDFYYIKGATGADQMNITDGPGDDTYKLRATPVADLLFADAPGDVDELKLKGVSLD